MARLLGSKTLKENAYANRSTNVKNKFGDDAYKIWGKKGGNPKLNSQNKGNNMDTYNVISRGKHKYAWSNQYQTALALVVKPLKTSLALVVENITIWLTSFPNLINQIPFRLAGN